MAGLASLASKIASNFHEKNTTVVLREANPDGSPGTEEDFVFQYFPETLTDTKQVNYQRRNVPGTSLPAYQWIFSGERSVGFTAYFTTDVDLLADPEFVNEIESSGLQSRNVDIRAALLRLRGYLLPEYTEDTHVVTVAPRRVYLQIEGSGIGFAGGSTKDPRDQIYCVMTQCDITWEQFFPSGLPRIVSVQLAFAEVAQKGGSVSLPAFRNLERDTVKGVAEDPIVGVYKYTLLRKR
jgi:hypothetical protein